MVNNSLDLIQNFLDNPDMTIAIFDVQGYFRHHTCTYYSLRINNIELTFSSHFYEGQQWVEMLHFTVLLATGHTIRWSCWVSRPVMPDGLISALDAAHARQLSQWTFLRAVHGVAVRFPNKIQRNANEYTLNLGGDDNGAPVCCRIDGHNGDILFYEKTSGRENGLMRVVYNKHNAGHINQILSAYKGYPKYFVSVTARGKTK